jgi:hypothetical protein
VINKSVCGFTAAVFAILAISFVVQLERSRAKHALKVSLVDEPFRNVAGGSNSVTVWDLRLVEMLAKDSECIANLNSISFSGVAFEEQDAIYLSKLKNVRAISFYDCDNVEYAIQGLVTLQVMSLYFESTELGESAIQMLGKIANPFSVEVTEPLNSRMLEKFASIPNATLKNPGLQ